MPEAESCLLAYGWEGNIRELDNVMQRALILASGDEIAPEHLLLPVKAAKIASAPSVEDESEQTVLDIKEVEKQHILDTLRAVGGVRKLAAERLNMSERTLRHKLQQYRDEGHFQG